MTLILRSLFVLSVLFVGGFSAVDTVMAQSSGAACPVACQAGACTGNTSHASQYTCASSTPNCCLPAVGAACPVACQAGACTGNTSHASQYTCSSSTPNCCLTAATTGPAASYVEVKFDNIVGFTKVNEFLTRILSFLQGFIVTLAILFIIIGGFLYITSAGNDGQMETAKKCILGALIGLALGIAAPAFLKEIYTILGTDTSMPTGVGTTLSILQIAENVLSFLLTIIGIIAIIMLIIGGIMYLTAAGNEDQIDKAKKIVTYSLIGILIALASLVLVRQLAAFFS